MSRSTFRASLTALSCVAAGAAPAAAQGGGTAPPATASGATAGVKDRLVLGIEIHVAQAELDAHAVRDAVTSDLGVPVTEATAEDPTLGVITITLERSAVRVVYRRSGAPKIERVLTLPAAPDERVQLIAFIVTNLVRDQASEVLAQLAPRSDAAAAPVDAALPDARPGNEMIATIGLVPPLSVDRLFGSHVVVGAGLHLVMGVQEGSRYLSVSGAVDYQRRFASGVQIAGAAAISRKVDGAQIAGAASIASDLHGAQIAGAASVASQVHGMQIGGAATYAGGVHGVQLAGGAAIAGEVHGIQISPVNVAGKLHGLQLGIVNISDGDDDAVPIGLINFARHGRTEVEAAVDSSEMSTLTLRHGPRYVQNVWGVGYVAGYDKALIGIGLGAHQAFSAGTVPFTVDVDAMMWTPGRWNSDGLMQLNQLRATLAVPVGPIDIVGGVIGNVHVEDVPAEMGLLKDLHPHGETTYTSGTTRVTLWPSGFLGLRLRA
jgi:hypothetical protein